MSRRLTTLALVAAAPFALAACAASSVQANADALTPDQLALLDRHLGGKVAGEAVSCLPGHAAAADSIRVSDNILLYRVSGNLVYKNDLRGGCPGLARDSDIMVSRQYGSGPCRGDIIHLVDRTSGIGGASCVLGAFTPYRTVR
ncbi:MAG: DUF6491 family protein [Sphingopyxis sp.]